MTDRNQAFLAGYNIALKDVERLAMSLAGKKTSEEIISALTRIVPPKEMPLVHLVTGVIICGKHSTWCGADIVADEAKVLNAIQWSERCTCVPCLEKLQKATDANP